MKVICDIEADGLHPTKIWVVVCKDIEKGDVYVFHPYRDPAPFELFSYSVTLWVGHNFLGYDLPNLNRLLDLGIEHHFCVDTLVLSRLTDATRKSHSLEAYGAEFGRPKLHANLEDWSQWTQDMEDRCKSDVEINFLLYKKFEKYLASETWQPAIRTEHFIAHLCHAELSANGFPFDYTRGILLKKEIDNKLYILDNTLRKEFLPKVILKKEYTPRLTKFGTINRQSVPRCLGNDMSVFTADAPFSLIEFQEFNPGSAKQRVERLNEAGWKPTEKTEGHKDALRALSDLRRKRRKTAEDWAAMKELEGKLEEYNTYGWKTTEENLATLPETAPQASRKLVERLLLASRSSTLESWIALARPSQGEYRVHGNFNHILPWTHRMSHDNPNLGNIPKFNSARPETTPYSDQMRALWKVRPDRLMVGVDAESIQLRIFGHYINDQEFINACVRGNKKDGSDPHSVNQRALGPICKSRDDAKTFIYAKLLGSGIGKIATILKCSTAEAQEADENFLDRYDGLRYIKEKVLPLDAERGYFQGFDGRYVKIKGDDYSERLHYALAGYLQNGEAVIMKRAVEIWFPKLKKEGIPFWWVNFVHDEYQTETTDDIEIAKYIAQVQADAIRQVGEDLRLRCPMAGSFVNDHGGLTIGKTWLETH